MLFLTNWPLPFAIVAFLLGAIPFGYVVGKLRGVDVRQSGSGNIGATNVSRTMGWQTGVLVLVLDALKVAVPTWTLWWFTGRQQAGVIMAVAGMLGHVFSPFVGFRGGKGVACLLGAMLVLQPLATGICMAAFVGIMAASRLVSLGSLAAAVVLPVALLLLHQPGYLVMFGVFAAILVLFTHRANIARLRNGTEPKFGQPASTER